MSTQLWKIKFCLVALLSCTLAIAQQGTPHIGYIYPAGGQQGSTFEAIVGGQFLSTATVALVSGSGVEATVLEYVKPIQPGEAGRLRDRMKELQESKKASPASWKDDDEKELHSIRLQLAQFERRTLNVAIAEKVRLRIHINANAPLGQHELRLETANGLSDPLFIQVGNLPEWSKQPAGTVTEEDANDLAALRKRITVNPPPTPTVDLKQPILVNGQVAPGGVDRYRFTAHKGEHLIATVSARSLVPYIADAVPGWFQPSLTLYDAAGKELAYSDHYTYHPDPVLLTTIPADGTYTLSIHDSIYRGREDFVYRIALGELPFVTSIFPMGGKSGERTTIELHGWNLKGRYLAQSAISQEQNARLLSDGDFLYSPHLFSIGTLPERIATGTNRSLRRAQHVDLPLNINGRIEKAGEDQYFQFQGKAGEEIEACVDARKLGSPLDSLLELLDAKGQRLAINDDSPDEGAGLLTDQADSLLRYKLPQTGIYIIKLTDSEGHGSPDAVYRLRISHPIQDFELRISPSSVNAKAGSITPITIYATRRGGWDGDITLHLKQAPAGSLLSGGTIFQGETEASFTLAVSPDAPVHQLEPLQIEGTGSINGHTIRHLVFPADDRTQAFYYHHLVMANQLLLGLGNKKKQISSWYFHPHGTLQFAQDGMTTLKVALPKELSTQARFTIISPTKGITIEKVTPAGNHVDLLVKASILNGQPAQRGNLVVNTTLKIPAKGESPNTKPRVITETLPALSFEVTRATLQKLSMTNHLQ